MMVLHRGISSWITQASLLREYLPGKRDILSGQDPDRH